MSKFKAGDRVICIDQKYLSGGFGFGVVTEVNPPKITVLYGDLSDDYMFQTWFEDKFEFQHIYNSPLYQALL